MAHYMGQHGAPHCHTLRNTSRGNPWGTPSHGELNIMCHGASLGMLHGVHHGILFISWIASWVILRCKRPHSPLHNPPPPWFASWNTMWHYPMRYHPMVYPTGHPVGHTMYTMVYPMECSMSSSMGYLHGIIYSMGTLVGHLMRQTTA